MPTLDNLVADIFIETLRNTAWAPTASTSAERELAELKSHWL
jgi:hypothetical protein